MPIPYKHKRSTAAGVAPSTLQDGEIAINVAASDPKLFYKDSSSTIRAFSLASYASASHTHVVADVTDFTTKANVVSVNGITGVVSISHTDVTAASASHSHSASAITSGLIDSARLPQATTIAAGAVIVGTGLGVSSGTVSVTYGTTSGTACQGNDSRLSDARTPTSHSHGNITNAGAIGSTANLPIITTTSGVLTTGSFGTTAATFCEGNDSRLSDTRTPTDGSVTTAKLANDAVTYAKIQNVSATDRLLGRSSAGSGDVEEITCTAFGRSLIDDADAATARTTLSVQPTASPAFTGAATFDNTGNVVPLTITNTGTANSFVVNDESGDTTPFVVDAAGRVVAGGSAPASEAHKVSIVGTLPTVSNQSVGYIQRGTVPSSSTVAMISYSSLAITDAASFTLSSYTHFRALQSAIGAGSSITNQYGFVAHDSLTGATNNYGFYSDIASGTGRWNFYANGTAQSYFGGQVLVTAGSGSSGSYKPGVAVSGDDDTGLQQVGGAGTISLVTQGTERVRVDASGNVGIGASSPSSLTPRLHISSAYSAATASTPYNGVFIASSDAQAANTGGVLSLGGLYDASSGPTRFAAIAGLKENGTSGEFGGYLAFYTRANGSTPAERVRVKATGAVRFVPLSADPSTGNEAGDVYYNSTTNKLRVYNGTSWVDLH